MQLSREQWLELAAEHGTPHVTLTMPLEHEAITNQKNLLRWKNLLAEADRQLERFGMTREHRTSMLSTARSLLERREVGSQGAQGIAMLLSRDHEVVHWCGHPLREDVRVSDRFDLAPLLDHLLPEPVFHVLAISDHGARLLRCTSHEVTVVPVPSAPRSLDAANAVDVEPVPSSPKQGHVIGAVSGAGGDRRGAIAQQGFGHEPRRLNLLEVWVRAVHEAIGRDVGPLMSPLILASTERVHGMWRELFGDESCLQERVAGNPTLLTDQELFEEAWPRVAPLLRPDVDRQRDRYFVARRDGKATRDLEDVLRAAVDQRIETLFVRHGGTVWGRVLDDGRVLPLQSDEPGAVDLSAQAVALALLNGGRVIEVDELPEASDGTTCNAILRW